MSLVIAPIQKSFDLYYAWIEEVRKYAFSITNDKDAKYLVFVDSDDTFVYFPEITLENTLQSLPEGVMHNLMPILCSHTEDLSFVSFLEFSGLDVLSYSEYAIEDITIGDVMKQLTLQLVFSSIHTIQDFETRQLFQFLYVSNQNYDTSTLLSYLKHRLIEKGEIKALRGLENNIQPQKHTKLELGSELIKCNNLMYQQFKNTKTSLMLDSIHDSRSKSEMEHKLCGLVYEILCDQVVNCMGELWCFTDLIWKEYSADGYLWNFLTNTFIDYLNMHDSDKIALHLMSVTVRTKLLKDIKLRLQEDSFYTKLDSKINIINMMNGVYNTDTELLSLPVPSDYVSIRTGVPYEIFDTKSADIQKLLYILESIFPEYDVLDFFLTSCATFLEGYNKSKVFYIWWGYGNNAKSLIQTLVLKTFGEYCGTAPTSLVTGKRGDASGATPELCHVEKKLVVFLQEPNPEERIKAGKMKELTGNDTMYVRQLFKAGKTMNIKSKFVIVCNNIIEIPGMDAAIRRRIVVIPFMGTFLEQAEYEEKERKGTLEEYSQIINPSIEKDILSCTSAFMYLLCRRHSENKELPLNLPPIIRRTTNHYITKNNYPLKFITTFVQRNIGSYAAVTEIYELYKEWYRRSYPGKRVQDYEIFIKELNDEGYKENENGIIADVIITFNGELTGTF